MSDEKRKTEPPLHIDLPFDEALTRYALTDPAEVEPPKGKPKKKRAKLKMLPPRLKELPPLVSPPSKSRSR